MVSIWPVFNMQAFFSSMNNFFLFFIINSFIHSFELTPGTKKVEKLIEIIVVYEVKAASIKL